MIPRLHVEIAPRESKRHGRWVKISPMKSRGGISAWRQNLISVKEPQPSILVSCIRIIANKPLAVFKRELAKFLKSVPDQPSCGAFVGRPPVRSGQEPGLGPGRRGSDPQKRPQETYKSVRTREAISFVTFHIA